MENRVGDMGGKMSQEGTKQVIGHIYLYPKN